MNNTFILRFLQQVNTWLLVPSIILLFYINIWYYYFFAFVSIILISKIGASIGQHRYFTHKSFKTSEIKEKVMAFLAVLSTTGTTLQYVTVHRYHHINSDNGKDLHSPHEIGYWKSFWHWYVDNPTEKVPLSLIRDLLKKSHLIFYTSGILL